MKRLFNPVIGLLAALCLFACQSDQDLFQPEKQITLKAQGDIEALQGSDPYERRQIDRYAKEQLIAHDEFRWEWADDKTLWSAVINSDSIVSIGYQPEGFQNLKQQIHRINFRQGEWLATRKAIIDFVMQEEGMDDLKQLIVFEQTALPYLNLRISRYETLAKLRRIAQVRYVEPMGYGLEEQQSQTREIACNGNGSSNVPEDDYVMISPGSKMPWNYPYMNIDQAWNHSQGDDIGVGVIDTGLSPDQKRLNSQFATGESTGRWVDKTGFFVSGWWWNAAIDGPDDDCGHGTGMAGLISAPRTDKGTTVGVAYKSNLVSVRGTDDVIINSSREKNGVSNSLRYLGDRNDVHIISMSIGDIFTSNQVADAIRYANNKGKMIFAAAGTSVPVLTTWWGVIFPANMDETVAVTGVRSGNDPRRCSACHSGSKVDFTIVMQDENNGGRLTLTLPNSGKKPKPSNGSSPATATAAGIAALIWAQNPNLTQEQVYDIMKEAGSNYPNKDRQLGWGTVNALEAVRGVL